MGCPISPATSRGYRDFRIESLYNYASHSPWNAMSDPSHLRRQADIFDRVADQCSVPDLVPYYRKLAQDYRARIECPADETSEVGCAKRASR
jgi:hypothetical protein